MFGLGSSNLSPYACQPSASKGRLFKEAEDSNRTAYQRDRDRIIHSSAFRRLETKTQVIPNSPFNRFRSRLTHSIEVAQLGRTIARQLGVNEDLTEAICLAHDLGHPPFSHVGEDAIDGVLKDVGGYDHNEQTLMTVVDIEKKYIHFNGLNLSFEVLEGLAKHNGPYLGRRATQPRLVPPIVQLLDKKMDFMLDQFASSEAQIAALADDIAYINHDLDDAITNGIMRMDDLHQIPLIAPILTLIDGEYGELETPRRLHEVVRRLINTMVRDLIQQTKTNVKTLGIRKLDDVREAKIAVVAHSESMQQSIRETRSYLKENMYNSEDVQPMREAMRDLMAALMKYFLANPTEITVTQHGFKPQSITLPPSPRTDVQRVINYVATLTEREAIQLYQNCIQPLNSVLKSVYQ